MIESFRNPKANVTLIILHTLLTLAAPLFIFLLTGCIDTKPLPVEYGPEVQAATVESALSAPTAVMKATDIQVGEYFAMETTQDLALGASLNTVGISGATITAKTLDTTDETVYSGVLKTLTYQSDGTYSKSAREGNILCAMKTPCGCGACDPQPPAPVDPCAASSSKPSDNSSSSDKPALASIPLIPGIGHQSVMSQSGAKAFAQSLKYTSPEKVLAQATCPLRPPSFHHLKTWKTVDAPPPGVTQMAGCLGIKNCLINVYHVSFDEVFWDSKEGDKLHVETMMSPDVPYLSRNLSTCQSLLVPVGTKGSNILLKQCSNVIDFRYNQ